MGILDIVKDEISNPSKISLTGLEPVDKVVLAMVGSVGMGALGIIIATGIYKMPPLSTLSATAGYESSKRMLKGFKILWDMVEPLLRNWKPELKEKFYYIDQIFDFIQNFVDKEEIGKLFRSGNKAY